MNTPEKKHGAHTKLRQDLGLHSVTKLHEYLCSEMYEYLDQIKTINSFKSVWVRFCYYVRFFKKQSKQIKTKTKPFEFPERWGFGKGTEGLWLKSHNKLLEVIGGADVC